MNIDPESTAADAGAAISEIALRVIESGDEDRIEKLTRAFEMMCEAYDLIYELTESDGALGAGDGVRLLLKVVEERDVMSLRAVINSVRAT